MFKDTNPKLIKYTNTETVMCLMKEVGERITLKRKKIIGTLGGTDDIRVTFYATSVNILIAHILVNLKKSGWSNPLKHLLTHWTPDKLTRLVTQTKKEDSVILTEFMVPEKDMEIKMWLRMIISKNNPISIVQDPIYREFAGFKHKISIGVVRTIIFKMTELVEEKIVAELKTTTCGAIMHDRWSRYGVHYLCYFACYILDIHPKSRLISLAPMANKEANEDTETSMEDETNFNSETHKTHFITIMKDIFEIDLITWGRASIVDNTNSNFKNSAAIKDTSCRMLQSHIQLGHEEYDW